MCSNEFGSEARIVASTDVAGYGAIALARRGKGSVAGISLGRATQAEANRRAIEQCLEQGGVHPRIRSNFKG